jgi:hypothetical protein
MRNSIQTMLLAASILLFVPKAAPAQRAESDLKTLLGDAAYVFNRFEETTTGLDLQMDNWAVPERSKKLFRGELAAVQQNETAEKARLSSLLGKDDISTVDLFDVYSEILEVSSELQAQASNFASWDTRGSEKYRELAELGAKATVLGGHIRIELRAKIGAEELELTICMNKKTSESSHHK